MKTELKEKEVTQTDEFFGEITDMELLMSVIGGVGIEYAHSFGSYPASPAMTIICEK